MKDNCWFGLSLVFVLLCAACSLAGSTNSTQNNTTLTVSAAASLTGPFSEMGKLFETTHPGVKVILNFAGSQQLAQQIILGAPVEVFASASPKQMETLIQEKLVTPGTEKNFASNRLVIITSKENPTSISSPADLGESSYKLVLAAQEVPVGQYTLDFLDRASQDPAFGADFKARVLKNTVSYEDNVKAVLSKVALGEADAGVVYSSDVIGPNAEKVGQIEIPNSLNVRAIYPIAVILDRPHPELASAFVDLVLSAEGQKILAAYGFLPAPDLLR